MRQRSPMRVRRSLNVVTACLLTVGTSVMFASGAGAAVSRPSRLPALSATVNDKVIVVLKNQIANVPDTTAMRSQRDAAVADSQRPLLAQLAQTHAKNV